MDRYGPPKLDSLRPYLSRIPPERLGWIAEKHLQYLDGKFHEIDILTDYLASCREVAPERREFISFVEVWTNRQEPDLEVYLGEYASRYHAVRTTVNGQCERILSDETLWSSNSELTEFWKEFAYINEIDSLHGMFLTSGRWNVNVMLPAIKELAVCTLPEDVKDLAQEEALGYWVAKRLITPNFAEVPDRYDAGFERRFAKSLIPLLRYYDQQLLFLFEALKDYAYEDYASLEDFVNDIKDNTGKYGHLLDQGVFPPFAWHELRAARDYTARPISYDEAIKPLMQQTQERYRVRANRALTLLDVLKEYELNYNNYNYKGQFGLVSKLFYFRTAELMDSDHRAPFLNAILGDRFFEALRVIEQTFVS